MTATVRFVQSVTKTDQAFIALLLANVGIKTRTRMFPRMVRVVLKNPADQATVDALLVAEGYCGAPGMRGIFWQDGVAYVSTKN